MSDLSENYIIIKDLFLNPDGIFKEDTCIHKCFTCIFACLIFALIYFSLGGFGLLSWYTWYHNVYNIESGCKWNETCTRPQIICTTHDVPSWCVLAGLISLSLILAVVLGVIVLTTGICMGISELKEAYVRIKKKSDYEEVGAGSP